jgi:uncharacterized protein (TIGR00369 family)
MEDGRPANPELTGMLRSSMPYAEALDIEVAEASPERVVASAPWRSTNTTAGGAMHGGHLMALADSVGALCAFLSLPAGSTTSTIESKTNFLRSVTSGRVEISATPIHVGRTTIVVQTDITRDDGKLVTRTIQTQAVTSRDRGVGDSP